MKSVKTLQRKGFNVSAGFIIGFDSDKENILKGSLISYRKAE